MKCPGQDTQYWTAAAIFEAACPQCGVTVEFFKDDTTRKCGQCGHRFVNPRMDFGCAAYCSFAEQCLGDLPPELVAQKEDLLKDRVAIAVKRHLKSDFKRIGRAVRRARHAEEIGKVEPVSLALVLMAAYLWDFDERGAGGDTPEARAILEQLKAPQPMVDQVCGLLAKQQECRDQCPGELQVVTDAAAIAALEETIKEQALARADLEVRLQGLCHTSGGQALARKVFLG